MIKVGENLPNFTLPANGGAEVSLSDYAGKIVVLYFYPKDATSGCTKQAISFTELAEQFAAANAVVLGVSKDSVTSHDKFVAKQELSITLLSDAESDLCETMGVWKEKSMYGKTYMGIERSTFLIDGNGKLVQEWRKVRVPGHVEAVLETVQAL